MRKLLLACCFAAAGCSGETIMGTPDTGRADGGAADATALDTGASDASRADGGVDGGADGGVEDVDAAVLDASDDAEIGDAGPLPLTVPVDDGTVVLPHTLPDCAPSAGVAADGTIFVAHSRELAADGVRVARLEGSAWVAVGGALNGADQNIDINICPSMVVTADGVPYVGFLSSSATQRQVRVRRFVSGAWEDALAIDRPIAEIAPALDLALTLDAAGAPVVALVEFVGFEHFVTVRRLVAGTFVVEGTPLEASSRGVRVASRPDGSIVVLRTHRSGFGTVARISTLTAGVWTTLPDVEVTGDSRPLLPDDIDADAASVVVSYSVVVPPYTVRTSRSTGAAVVSVGTEPEGIHPSTSMTGTGLVQVFQSGSLVATLRVHDGTAWGTPIVLPFTSNASRMVAGPPLHVAYSDGASAHLVRVNLP